MGEGYLKVQVHTGDDALPVAKASVVISGTDGKILFRTMTDENGNTETFRLSAPDMQHTLDPYYGKPAYSVYNVDISAVGYVTKHVNDVPIVDTQTALLKESLQPLIDERVQITDDYIYIAPISLLNPVPNRQRAVHPPAADENGRPVALDANSETVPNALSASSDTLIPEYITVHLGIPTNAAARNVKVKFPDYIKNVASSEIYSTWPRSSLEANIYAIITFALNRVYTEWYPSRGYNFNITNSTAYDMFFRDGGPVYESISKIVDNIFNVYARRRGFENPFFTQFCNGTTSTCSGLSQWGTVALANQGRSAIEILHHYYPNDLELVMSNNIQSILESYPGYTMSLGTNSPAVQRMQNFLNRIRVNYPLIPQIPNPNGMFDQATQNAVRTFQRTFNMTADGIIGRATWNKITFLFVAVTRLAELDSEGIRITIGNNPPNVVLNMGSRGANVIELQFLLNYISTFYPSVPTVIQDGVFGTTTKNAVIEFQKTFGLTPDGIVGPATWNKLYAVYRGIDENVPSPPVVDPPPANNAPPFPGTPLKIGSTGADVRTMQSYLNVINAIYPSVPKITVDGIFGSETENAVKAFQRQVFLVPDGIIGSATWDKIVEAFLLASGSGSVSLDFPGTLKRGSVGASVRLMQTFLAELRAAYPSLPQITVDGVFGANTEAAVIGFQRLFGLVPDGIIGPATWNAIIRQKNSVS